MRLIRLASEHLGVELVIEEKLTREFICRLSSRPHLHVDVHRAAVVPAGPDRLKLDVAVRIAELIASEPVLAARVLASAAVSFIRINTGRVAVPNVERRPSERRSHPPV